MIYSTFKTVKKGYTVDSERRIGVVEGFRKSPTIQCIGFALNLYEKR